VRGAPLLQVGPPAAGASSPGQARSRSSLGSAGMPQNVTVDPEKRAGAPGGGVMLKTGTGPKTEISQGPDLSHSA
jgi:hypothetical protein